MSKIPVFKILEIENENKDFILFYSHLRGVCRQVELDEDSSTSLVDITASRSTNVSVRPAYLF